MLRAKASWKRAGVLRLRNRRRALLSTGPPDRRIFASRLLGWSISMEMSSFCCATPPLGRHMRWLLFSPLIFCLLTGAAIGASDELGIRLGEASVARWRFGLTIKATGVMSGIVATLPVPMDWPEQAVKKIDEQKSPHG